MYVVVVFPFVPVIPMTFNSSAGYPKYAADVSANAYLVSSTLMTVTCSGASTSFSTITAMAPFSTTSDTKSCPSTTAPLMQTNTLPSVTFLESFTNSVISMSSLPCKTSYLRRSNSLVNFIICRPPICSHSYFDYSTS